MIILGVDTSAVAAGAAIVKDGKLISETYINTGLTHSETLLTLIDSALNMADMSIDEALTEMSNHRRNLAVVRDIDGNIAGILTVEDILEELVGEIYDEDDIGGTENE